MRFEGQSIKKSARKLFSNEVDEETGNHDLNQGDQIILGPNHLSPEPMVDF